MRPTTTLRRARSTFAARNVESRRSSRSPELGTSTRRQIERCWSAILRSISRGSHVGRIMARPSRSTTRTSDGRGLAGHAASPCGPGRGSRIGAPPGVGRVVSWGSTACAGLRMPSTPARSADVSCGPGRAGMPWRSAGTSPRTRAVDRTSQVSGSSSSRRRSTSSFESTATKPSRSSSSSWK